MRARKTLPSSGESSRRPDWPGMRERLARRFPVLYVRETGQERFIHIQMDELYDRANASENRADTPLDGI